jgi:hypothetical protein
MILFKKFFNQYNNVTRKLIFFSLLAISIIFAIPQAFADYRSDAEAINSGANPQGSLNETKAKDVIHGYGDTPPQTSYYNNPTAMGDQSQLALKNNDAGIIAKSAFDNKGDYDLSYLPKDTSSPFDVSDIIKLFTGSYSDCQPTTTTNSGLTTTNTCDQYYQAIQNSCQINRNIDVFSSYTYSCTKDLIYKNKACQKTLTIACDDNNGQCDAGGINLKSIASDMAWNYHYPILTIGSIGDNYWSQWGGTVNGCDYRRSISFDIRNVNDVTLFNLRSLAYDDQMSLAINGTQIFIGPYGSISGCREYSRTWTANPNIDLIPYLKNGANTIEIRVLVGGRGEAWLNIEARQRCCNNPREVWTEVCS